MKNNFKPSKGQFSKNPTSAGQKSKSFDRSSQPKKYGSFDKKKTSYRREDGNGYFSNRDNTGYKGNRDNAEYKGNRDNAGYKGNRDNAGFKGNRDNAGYKGSRDNAGYKGNRDNAGYKGNRDNAGYKGNRDNAGYKGNRDNAGFKGNRDNAFNRNYSDKKPRFENNRPEKVERNTGYAHRDNTAKFNKPYIKDTGNINIQEDVFENSRDMGSITFGRNAVIELLKSDKTIDKLFVQNNQREGSITMIVAEAVRKSIPVVEVEKQKLDKMINGTSHQGVVAMTSEVEYCSVDDILAIAEERNEKPFILIADKIMDAQNLGAILRTAECAGVHGVIIPKRHAVGVSSVVGKISAGALFHIKIAKVANIASTIEDLKEKGVWTFASTSDSINDREDINDSDTDIEIDIADIDNGKDIKNYCEVDYDLPLCLVVGNEGDGLSQIILQKSDFLINIPMYGKIESLNVSCAAAVLLYEIAKQREAKKL